MRSSVLWWIAAAVVAKDGGAAAFQVDSLNPTVMGMGGGLELTIIGEGFSGDEFNGANTVYLNGEQCEVMSEFTEETRIVCERVPPGVAGVLSAEPKGVSSSIGSTVSVAVQVNVDGRWITVTKSLSYAAANTPVLRGIGHVSILGGRMPFRGDLISRRPAQYRVEIGDKVKCSVLAQLEDANIEAVAEEPNAERHFFCSPEENPAGYYNASVAVETDLMSMDPDTGVDGVSADTIGTAIPSQADLPDLFKMTPHGTPYQVAHFASVSSMQPTEGSTLGGTLLTLFGSGFAVATEDTSVHVGSQNCEIVSASLSQLVCEVPAAPPSAASACACACPCSCCHPGAAGLLLEEWDLTNAPTGSTVTGDADGAVDVGDSSAVVTPAMLEEERLTRAADRATVWQEDLYDWDMLKFGTHFQSSGTINSGAEARVAQSKKMRNVGRVVSGFFEAPYTSDYTFYLSGNDFVYLYASLDGTSGLALVAKSTAAVNRRAGRYYQPGANATASGDGDGEGSSVGCVSAPIPLEKGAALYLEVAHADHTGDEFFHVAVSHDAAAYANYGDGDGDGDGEGDGDGNQTSSTGDTGTAAYHTVPTMATVQGGSLLVGGQSVAVPSSSACDQSATLSRRVESALGVNSHAVVESSVDSSGACRYHIHIVRPQGPVMISGSNTQVDCQGSLDWYYDPIPLSFLRLPVKTHSSVVTVTTNHLPATHNSTSGLAFTYSSSLQSVVSASAVDQTAVHNTYLRIPIESPLALVANTSLSTVTIGGLPCLRDSTEEDGEFSGLRVEMGLVQCRVPNLPAGDHAVSVHLGTYGTPAGGPFSTNFPLVVAGVAPGASGSSNGGAHITLTGQGFALDEDGENGVENEVTVSPSAAVCAIVRATRNSIVCTTPPGTGSRVITVTAGNHSASIAYTYTEAATAVVTSVELDSGETLSPAGGDRLVVNGENFPALGIARVLLCPESANTDCAYCETDVENSTATSIECVTPTLPGGSYEVRVQDPAIGWSQPGIVLLSSFSVTSISPASGSSVGGQALTIAGSGFSSDTYVLIGPVTETGLVCEHLSVAEERLVCRIERNTKQLRGVMTLRVYATQQESYTDGIHAACAADVCRYEMVIDESTSFSSVSPREGAATVTVSGTGLSGVTAVLAGETPCAVSSAGNTSVTCSMAQGPAGTYRLFVISPVGYAAPPSDVNQWFSFPVTISTVSPSEGSIGGGQIVTVTGSGFHADTEDSTTVAIGDSACDVYSVTATRIVCRSTAGTEGAASVSVTTGTIKSSAGGQRAYTFSSEKTPRVTSVSPRQMPAGGGTLTVKGTLLLMGAAPESVSVTLGGVMCDGATGTETELTCTVGSLPAMAASPVVRTTAGVSVAGRNTDVTVDLVFDTQDFDATPASIAGGAVLVLSGSGMTDVMEDLAVKVCGQPCGVLSADFTRSTCLLPKLPSRAARLLFPGLYTASTLTVASTTTSTSAAYTAQVERVTDGSTTTSGVIRNTLYLDAGENLRFDPTAVNFYPYDYADAPMAEMVGLEIAVSSGDSADGPWFLLHNVTSVPKVGWNRIPVNDSVPTGRYIRFTRPVPTWGQLAFTEVEVVGYKVAREVANGTSCAVEVTVSAPGSSAVAVRGDAEDGVGYAAAGETPLVTSFEPEHGSAAGGYPVTIRGSNLLPLTAAGDPDPATAPLVTFDGVPCPVTAHSATEITCVAGSRPQIPEAESIGSIVDVPNRGHAAVTADAFLYADLWSSPSTWAGGILPGEGDTVVLVTGRNIILDIDPPQLFFMLVDGALIFDDSADRALDMKYMLIRGGRLQIGKEAAPFQHKAVITLHGNRSSTPLPVYGTKNIAVRGGDVLLYGQPKTPTWTRLSATAAAGDRYVSLREATNWLVGDEIVVAPGGYDLYEYETRVVTSITDGGRTLHFETPLLHDHFGAVEDHYGTLVDMSVEVGVLSRNIKIQGDVDSWKQKFGAHLIFHSPDRPVRAHIQYTEFYRVGQAKIIGRYPIHFHMEKDRPQDVHVVGCSVHHSFNRAIVLHDTSYVTVSENVAFNALGHMFFVEDGVERYNTFTKNLGIAAKPTGGQLSHDVFTSVFWLANPQNNFIDNAAAGSTHMGFWVSPPRKPRRASADQLLCPNMVPLGLITGNTAHSCGRHGFWVHPDHFAHEVECDWSSAWAVSTVSDLRTWKNGEQGLGLVDVGPYILDGIVAIDNNDAGVEVGDVQGELGATVKNSVFIAHSKTNHPEKWTTFRSVTGYRGLITPKTEGFRGINLTFVGFKPGLRDSKGGTAEHAGVYTCCRCWNDCSSEMGVFSYRFQDTKWYDCPNRVMFGWPHNDLIVDEDGTFTGDTETPGEAGATITPYNPHVNLPGCKVGERPHESSRSYRAWTGKRDVPTMICPPQYAFHRLIIHEPTPFNQQYYTYRVASDHGITSNVFDEAVENFRQSGWAFPVATSSDPATKVPYKVWYGENTNWEELYIMVTELPWNPFRGYLQLDFNYTDNYALFNVRSRTQAGSRANLDDIPVPATVLPLTFEATGLIESDANYSTANMDSGNKTLSLVFSSGEPVTSVPGRTQFVQMVPIPCVTIEGSDQCIEMQDEVQPPEEWLWTDEEAWDAGVVPGDEDLVIIPKGRTIYLQSDTANLQTLIVQGRLVFQHGYNSTLSAKHVFIQSGELEIGNETDRFTGQARINLRGDFTTPSLAVSRTHFLGAAVLANFGVLSLYGDDSIGSVWTKLAETAAAGSTELVLVDAVGWQVGGAVVIPSTDYDSDHAEYATITGISGRTITITPALQYRHLGTTSDGFELRGEVGYLTRNIQIGNFNQLAFANGTYGAHVMYGELSDDPQFSGSGSLSYVEFSHCGQWGGDRGALLLDRLTRSAIEVDHLSLWNNNAYGVRLYELQGAAVSFTLRDSVIYRSRQSTVQMRNLDEDASDHVLVEGNLMGGAEYEGDPKIEMETCVVVANRWIAARRNVVAGSWGEGFCIAGDPCNTRPAMENEAHSCLHGWFLRRSAWCTELNGIHAWKNAYLGVFSMIMGNVVLRNSVLHDNHIAVNLIKVANHRTNMRISDTVIAGRSTSESRVACADVTCTNLHSDAKLGFVSRCTDRSYETVTFDTASVGILLGQSRLSSKIPYQKRTIESPFPYDKLGHASYYGATYVHNVTFKNFKVGGACGRDAALRTMGESRSHVLPHEITAARWENVDRDAKVYFHTSGTPWRTNVQCGTGWDCSGLQQVLVNSPDNSLLGETGEGTSSVVSAHQNVALASKCSKIGSWNAYECKNASYGELFVRSLDPDSYDRRVYPLRVQYLDVSGTPFYQVNQPPDKYKETEWPSFKRPSWFWAVIETQHRVRIDFGDLPPRRTQWEFNHCMANEKVLLSVHYPEPLRIQVWLDPDNNETGRTVGSEAMVAYTMSHSSNYFEESTDDNQQRAIHVVMQCGNGLEIHQLLEVRVAMRLDMSIEEFYDSSTSEQFATNIAMLLGISQDRVRIVDIQGGSVVVAFAIEAVDEQYSNAVVQEADLTALASRVENYPLSTYESVLGLPVAGIDSVSVTSGTPNSTNCYEGSNSTLCISSPASSSFPDKAWHYAVIVVGIAVFVALLAVLIIYINQSPVTRVQPESTDADSVEMRGKSQNPHEVLDNVNLYSSEDEVASPEAIAFPDFTPPQAGLPSPSSQQLQDNTFAYSPKLSVPQDRPRLRSMKINLHDDEDSTQTKK
ncbi:hypothetical protein DIPPA_26072 [Diplonema papillatum]|nr:hypothetical protein DIPPA_26072 [Diplonema papillatum]